MEAGSLRRSGRRPPEGVPTIQPGREVGPPAVPPVFGASDAPPSPDQERARGSIRRRPRAGSQHRRLSVARSPRGQPRGDGYSSRVVTLQGPERRVYGHGRTAATRSIRGVDISRGTVYRRAIYSVEVDVTTKLPEFGRFAEPALLILVSLSAGPR